MPILRRKLHRIFTLHVSLRNFAGKTSPAKLRQQKFANIILRVICHFSYNYVAPVGTYTNVMFIGINLATDEQKSAGILA